MDQLYNKHGDAEKHNQHRTTLAHIENVEEKFCRF
jgi:hypothetical protein